MSMRRNTIASLIGIVLTQPFAARADDFQVYYGLQLVTSEVSVGDSTASLPVAVDSTGGDVVVFRVQSDSLTIEWMVSSSGREPEFRVTNESAGPVSLVWDSSSALDLKGKHLELLFTGFPLNPEMRAAPSTIKRNHSFETSLDPVSRVNDQAVRFTPIISHFTDERDPIKRAKKARNMQGKEFQYTIGFDRGYRFDHYTFRFRIESVEIVGLEDEE